MKIESFRVTPYYARKLLEKNTNNFRKITKRVVEKYAREMKAGLWQENGEPIQIYEDGTLANGQHRLAAIIESGVTLPMVVVSGIPKTVTTFDRGKNRSVMEQARAMGIDISSQEAGAVGILLFGLQDIGRYGQNEMFDYYLKNLEPKRFTEVARSLRKGANHPILNKSGTIAAAYCAYTMGHITIEQIEKFSKIANSGVPIEGENSYAPLCLRKTYQTPFKDTNGLVISKGATIRVCHFETAYKALLDFACGMKRQKIYHQDGIGESVIRIARRIFEAA